MLGMISQIGNRVKGRGFLGQIAVFGFLRGRKGDRMPGNAGPGPQRQSTRNVASYATVDDERTRQNDERTRQFDERTQPTANEPESRQIIDLTMDFAVACDLAAGRAVRKPKIAERTGAALAAGGGS